ncbi:hypothetical protein EA58_02025 [Photobacterium galatheae]|uniref:Uncharacterized protein n=1 Tax=Photobacterium galatheae TaxID=1654360 RepID=A0A066S014_9GAMM|nr:hypothetical protein EA58_02025 [Photobacterium galatheae]
MRLNAKYKYHLAVGYLVTKSTWVVERTTENAFLVPKFSCGFIYFHDNDFLNYLCCFEVANEAELIDLGSLESTHIPFPVLTIVLATWSQDNQKVI